MNREAEEVNSSLRYISLIISIYVSFVVIAPTPKGHGTAAGTIYFSCWSGLFFSIDITTLNILRLVQEKEKKKIENKVVRLTDAETFEVEDGKIDTSRTENAHEIGLDPESREIELPIRPEHCVEAQLCDQDVAGCTDSQDVLIRDPLTPELRSELMFYSAQEDIFDDESMELVP